MQTAGTLISADDLSLEQALSCVFSALCRGHQRWNCQQNNSAAYHYTYAAVLYNFLQITYRFRGVSRAMQSFFNFGMLFT